ncbi:MAG: DUF4250 domain-containing protein [Eubacterium sp.]|nr:DUF4250 domain-containing protein [Eubacterium sp.]
MNLPSDPIMLMSVVNTQLRDKFSSFDELALQYDVDKSEIEEKLNVVGYIYDEELNQFRRR